jgi:hypothetical protein
MARNITLTLGAGLSSSLGPNFNLTADVGDVTPSTATKTELLLGKSVSVDDSATEVTITSVGVCTASITQMIPCIETTTIIDIGTNESLDIAIDLSNMTVNGVTVTDVIGTDPNTPGNGASVRTSQIGTYNIVLTYDSTISGQKIILIDSDGTPYCNNTTGGGSMTFYDVVIDGVNIVTITAFDGVCV